MKTDEELVALSDEEQVDLLQQTDNDLTPDDEGLEQPTQNPDVEVKS